MKHPPPSSPQYERFVYVAIAHLCATGVSIRDVHARNMLDLRVQTVFTGMYVCMYVRVYVCMHACMCFSSRWWSDTALTRASVCLRRSFLLRNTFSCWKRNWSTQWTSTVGLWYPRGYQTNLQKVWPWRRSRSSTMTRSASAFSKTIKSCWQKKQILMHVDVRTNRLGLIEEAV